MKVEEIRRLHFLRLHCLSRTEMVLSVFVAVRVCLRKHCFKILSLEEGEMFTFR